MATYTTLQKGSSNTEETKKLQQALKDNGYGSYLGSADVDGIYGSGTDAGVRAFQKDKGLQVDGIVGEKTWGALLSGSNTSAQTQNPQPAAQPEKSYRYDSESDTAYQDALKKKNDLEAAGKPTLQGTYDEQVKAIFDEIMGQKEFSYDLNGDALWQQYKDQYTTKGQMAMMDTMGQAAALTGGYGSSYAQGVGQQTYQGYLQQMNDRIPELYQLALQKYNNDQALLQEKFGAARELQADEYGRYRDQVSDYYTDLGFSREDENNLWNRGNSTWLTEQELRTQDEQIAYNRKQDAYNNLVTMIADTGHDPTDAELEEAGMTRERAMALGMQYDKDQAAAATAARGTGGGEGNEKISIPSEIKTQIGKYETNAEKLSYISRLEDSGIIDGDMANYMRAIYTEDFKGNDNTDAFIKKIHTKDQHDAVMRAMYGSYEQYVSQMIEDSDLNDEEKLWLISKYKITEADAQRKQH